MRNKQLFIGFGLLFLLFMTTGSASGSKITNTCTSTYTSIATHIVYASGWDTVIINSETPVCLVINKYAKNLRTGIESNYFVTALSGDTIEFRITWSNQGGASADTMTIGDPISSDFTYVGGSVTNAETNCIGFSSEAGGYVKYNAYNVPGTDPGPYGYGEVKFKVNVN